MKRTPLDAGFWVFFLALLLRGGWSFWRWFHGGAGLEFDDERLHWELARNLAQRWELVSDDGRYVARMPLYPAFLALFAGAGEIGALGARLAQAGFGAASAWIAHAIGRRHFGASAGLLAGLLVACDPYGVFFSSLLLSEALFSLLSIALIACALELVTGSPRSRAAAWGLALLGPAAVFTRPSSAGWVALLWAVLWLMDGAGRRAALRGLGYGVAMAAPLLIWGWRNTIVAGAPAFLSANGGLTLYDGQHPGATGGSDQSFLLQMPELTSLGEVERDQRLAAMARQEMREHPDRVLTLAWAKFQRTWSLFPNYAAYRGGWSGWAGAGYTLVVLLGAAAGCARLGGSRPGRRSLALLLLPVAYFTLLHCVYVGSVRYRVPLMPLLALLASAVVSREERAPLTIPE